MVLFYFTFAKANKDTKANYEKKLVKIKVYI